MHFKRYTWEIEFIDGKIAVIADSFDNAVLEAKRQRINKGLNSIVLSCKKVGK